MRLNVVLGSLLLTLLLACAAPPSIAPTKPSLTREQFDKLVIGKTPNEVIEAIGRPRSTSGNDLWHYDGEHVIDPISQKAEDMIHLRFTHGVVAEVSHH